MAIPDSYEHHLLIYIVTVNNLDATRIDWYSYPSPGTIEEDLEVIEVGPFV
jgi:hypothetical protein